MKGRRILSLSPYFIVGAVLASIVAAVVVYLVREANKAVYAVPMYGVFSISPAVSAYAKGTDWSRAKRLVERLCRMIASAVLSTVSLVIGTCIYAARKVTRR